VFRFRSVSLALAASAALVLTGCSTDSLSGGTDEPFEYATQEVAWDTCDTAWLVTRDQASAAFTESSVDCATIQVPGLYGDSGIAPDFTIAMMRVRPLDAPVPDDVIFINPGGPGGSGIEQVQYSDFPTELRESFAFIGFDPRGVGKSTLADGSSIKCSDVLDFVSYFSESTPSSEEELDSLIVENDRYYEDCVEANPYWWTLSTANVVADLELMRSLVTPDKPLNFIGSSYGTTIAGRYVSEYPEMVGKIVFDSPTTVDTDRIASGLKDWEAAEVKLRIYVQAYADHLGVSFDEAWARVLEIRQRGDDDLLVGYAGFLPSPTNSRLMVSSEALFTRGIFTLNYFPEGDAIQAFIQGMDDAYESNWNGTFEWLAFRLDGYDPDSLEGASLEEKQIKRTNEYEVRVIVNTMDFSLPPLTEEEQRSLNAQFQEVAPLWFELSSDASGYQYFGPPKGLDWYTLAINDPAIPDPPATPFIPSNSSGRQLLIIGSLYESVTPFSFAEDTAELLGAALISVDSDQHAPAAYYDNECLNTALIDYFLSDTPIANKTC